MWLYILSLNIQSFSITDDLVEKNQKEITIHDLDALALTLLVDFSYTGEIVISEDNVQVVIYQQCVTNEVIGIIYVRRMNRKYKSKAKLIVMIYFESQVLLPASSILQMATVREACCKFLMRQLHPTNCLGIRSFAGNNIVVIHIITD